ncbi:MAG: hypothetical protein P8X65_07750 [Syntrophobacterales bacterium]
MTKPPPGRWRLLSLKLLTVIGGLLAAFLLLEILLRFLGTGLLYRSPHEMLATFDYRLGHGRYHRNRQGEMHIPFGDMVSLNRQLKPTIGEPRLMRYKTDSLGFRNDADYRNEPLLLVGDSFIAGSGSTQADLLSAQLTRDYGIPAYNLAFPGKLHSYVRYVQTFFKTYRNSDARVLLFLFEGNDFPPGQPKSAVKPHKTETPPSTFRIARKEFQQSLKELLVYRYAYSLYHLLNKKLRPASYPQVTVIKVQGPRDLYLGFLDEYIKVTRRTPTKFRVYYNLLDLEPRPPLPDAQWAFLQEQARRLGVRCVNLTGPLQEESRRLLPEGKLTFWKDDSHWNRYGMAVAARTIQAFWQKQEVSDENVSLREGTRGRKPLPPPSSSLPQPLKGE